MRYTRISGVGFQAAIPTLGSVVIAPATFNIFAVHFSHGTAAASHSLPTIFVPTSTKPPAVTTAGSVSWVRLLTR
jgi:hypothetical protein